VNHSAEVSWNIIRATQLGPAFPERIELKSADNLLTSWKYLHPQKTDGWLFARKRAILASSRIPA
jgi:hypothetical protein